MGNASDEYLRNTVMTATPEQLHLMLYDGAIRFTRQGIEGVQRQNWEDVFNGFSRAQKIVLELLNSLNPEVDRALCSRMAGLYNFIYRKLVDAGVQRDAAPAQEALKLLEYQRETWLLLMDKLRSEGGSARPTGPMEAVESPDDNLYGTLSVQG
ncbi:MAG: hypothetical protein AMXMBFR13_15470 [Phycisphaerae bacterium]